MDGVKSNKVEAVGADGSRESGGIMDGVESNKVEAVHQTGHGFVCTHPSCEKLQCYYIIS